MSVVGPLSIDMYLPGFPSIEREFHEQGVERTMAAYMIGIAVPQRSVWSQAAVVRRFLRLCAGLVGMRIVCEHDHAHHHARRASVGRLRGICDRPCDRA